MQFSIPLHNETIKRPNEKKSVYRVRALFFPNLRAEDTSLRRATNRLLNRVRKQLDPLGRDWNHEELVSHIYNPTLSGKRLKLTLELKHRRAKVAFYFVTFHILGRQVAFPTRLPDLWFDIGENQTLESRATEVLENFFRNAEKDLENFRPPEEFQVRGETWISWANIGIRTDPPTEQDIKKDLLALFDHSHMDGATELGRVGRCLDLLYPDELQRTVLRDSTVAELERLLSHPSRRPIMLIGQSLVGKTALVHEIVFRRVDQRKNKSAQKKNVWWLSPQRLITGMSYVGQWENRLLAILRESKKRDHVLYFDQWLSMFRAGQSRESNLCVADLIKNCLQVRDVRMLGEMTPEQFHALAQRDQSLADLFHVVRVEPTDEAQTRAIGIRSIQRLELENRCVFSYDTLPTAMRLLHSYSNLTAFPGKLVKFLSEAAIKHRDGTIDHGDCLVQFQKSTGLSYRLLDESTLCSPDEVRRLLSLRIVGQKKAVEICTRIISIAKARLNENGRPLGSLLFVGPTGVGKTECAKALCQVMFENEDRLLRFDLNQFKTGFAASTLIGTPDNPEGLLTSAVRHQPFSIVLLDEIEKAHPDVLDILLQVLGEGRLTDSLGRTTDFSNCVIIMTSNLGTSHREHEIGFSGGDSEHRFIRAARQFFRPEIFNRLDEIVAFEKLNRQQIAKIAQIMIRRVVSRQGLSQRQCILQIDPAAIDRVVELGYHPTLGARAMKRALEEQFSQPVANTLSHLPFDKPTLIRLYPETDRLGVQVESLRQVEPNRDLTRNWNWQAVYQAAEKLIARVRESELSHRPPGELSPTGMTPELLRFYSIDEQTEMLAESVRQLQETATHRSVPQLDSDNVAPVPRVSGRKMKFDSLFPTKNLMKEVFAAKDIETYLQDHLQPATGEPLEEQILSVLDESALLQAMIESDSADAGALFIRPIQSLADESERQKLANLNDSLKSQLEAIGFEVSIEYVAVKDSDSPCWLLTVEGPCVSGLIESMTGSVLNINQAGRCTLIQVGTLTSRTGFQPVPILDNPTQGNQGQGDRTGWKPVLPSGEKNDFKKRLLECLAAEPSTLGADHPFTLRPVIRIERQNKVLDLRSGCTFQQDKKPGDTAWLLKRALPLPPEFLEAKIDRIE